MVLDFSFPSLSRLDEGGTEDGMGQFGCPDLVCCCPGWVCCCPDSFVAGSWKAEWWKEQPLSTDECTGEDSARDKFSRVCLLLTPPPSVPDNVAASGINILRDANPSDLCPKSG